MKNEIKKAVTSEAAPAENGPENDAQLNGENKPTLQEAKTPAELAETPAEATVERQELPEGLDAAAQGGQTEETNTEEEAKEEETPAAKDVSFGNFFGDTPYKLGSTLEQAPSGNVMSDMKAPAMDYVERAKNHHNVEISPEDLKDEKE